MVACVEITCILLFVVNLQFSARLGYPVIKVLTTCMVMNLAMSYSYSCGRW